MGNPLAFNKGTANIPPPAPNRPLMSPTPNPPTQLQIFFFFGASFGMRSPPSLQAFPLVWAEKANPIQKGTESTANSRVGAVENGKRHVPRWGRVMDIEKKGSCPKQNRFLLGKRAKWADRVRRQFARGDRKEWKTVCPAMGACHGYRGKGTAPKTEPIPTRQKGEVGGQSPQPIRAWGS